MDEGELQKDNLHETFGRRIYMEGSIKIGWFLKNGDQLHGYGLEAGYGMEGDNPGHFEVGKLRNENEILQYDTTIDFISHQIEFMNYIETHKEIKSEI